MHGIRSASPGSRQALMRLGRRELVFGTVVAALGTAVPAAVAAQPEATPEGDPIRIGASISTSGTNGGPGRYQHEGEQAWAAQVNEAGGLLGRPVELVVYEDGSDPERGARNYERLITEDRVDLVLGPSSSGITLAAAEVTEQHGYPMLASGGSAAGIWERGHRYVFGVIPIAQDYFRDIVRTIGPDQGYTTAAVIYGDALFQVSAGQGAVAHCAPAGIEVVHEESYPLDATDLSDLLARIRDLDPDMVIAGSYHPDSVLIVRQARGVGLNADLFAFSIGAALPEFGETLGADADYVLGPSMWEPGIATEGNQEFVAAYTALHGREPAYQSALGYAGCQVLERAIADNGDLDRETLRDTLAGLTMGTILPGEHRVDETGRQVGHIPLTVQWQDGQKVLVAPEEFRTGELDLPTPAWDERGG